MRDVRPLLLEPRLPQPPQQNALWDYHLPSMWTSVEPRSRSEDPPPRGAQAVPAGDSHPGAHAGKVPVGQPDAAIEGVGGAGTSVIEEGFLWTMSR